MIDKDILDEVLPVPDLEELARKTTEELKREGFVITNFHSGGVFYTLLMIVLRIKIEFTQLLRTVLNNMFVSHASGAWLDLKLADYSKKRKKPQKTRGFVTISRETPGEAVKIAKGHVFKTAKDINGEELRFFVLEASVLQKGALSTDILVEAEAEGSRYNIPQGQITRSLTYINGIESITNASDWITREGSDSEDDDSLRDRGLRSWSELAQVAIHDTYVNVCEAVTGVLHVEVNDQHPRGQGTIDVIVTSEAGAATESLLTEVRAACEIIKAPDDDVLVKSAETVPQPIALTVTVLDSVSREGLEAKIQNTIISLLKISRARKLNELTHADIIYAVKRDVSVVRNVIVTSPAQDLFLASNKVILPGAITVTIEGV